MNWMKGAIKNYWRFFKEIKIWLFLKGERKRGTSAWKAKPHICKFKIYSWTPGVISILSGMPSHTWAKVATLSAAKQREGAPLHWQKWTWRGLHTFLGWWLVFVLHVYVQWEEIKEYNREFGIYLSRRELAWVRLGCNFFRLSLQPRNLQKIFTQPTFILHCHLLKTHTHTKTDTKHQCSDQIVAYSPKLSCTFTA